MRCHRAGAPQRKQLDEWDAEYDRGKQKKVKGRGPDEWEDGGNRFQDAWNSRQHGGGRHHKQVGRLSHGSIAVQVIVCLAPPRLVCCDERMLLVICTATQAGQPPRNASCVSKMQPCFLLRVASITDVEHCSGASMRDQDGAADAGLSMHAD